jgi:arylsulfatase A-like enzyme
MRCTDAHAPTAVCTPTRYALLTGRYAWRSRLQRGVLPPWAPPLIAADRLTLPELLSRHGYATACIGKWHLGWMWPTKDGGRPVSNASQPLSNVDFTRPIADGPTTRGFSYYFGTDVPNYPPYCFIEDSRTVGLPSVPQGTREEHFNRIGPAVSGWKMVDILPELTRRAVRYIEEKSKASSRQPFFLYMALTSPHYPVVPSSEFVGKSGAGSWGDFVAQTDWSVGQVIDALERAGVAEDTLVIFTSDNGPEIIEVPSGAYENLERYGHASMGNLRGVKRDAWEGGHRVPLLVRWPGRVARGAVSDDVVCLVDFMATAAALVGEKLPDNSGEDSYNLLPVLTAAKPARPVREATVLQSGFGKFALRKGDWVFIDAPTGSDNAKQEKQESGFNRARGYSKHDQPGELYNLRQDPTQHRNVYSEHPEIVRDLKELLERYKRNGRSTPGAAQQNDVRL